MVVEAHGLAHLAAYLEVERMEDELVEKYREGVTDAVVTHKTQVLY